MDDIFIISSDVAGMSALKIFLHGQFQTKNLGSLKYFLGVEVARCKNINLFAKVRARYTSKSGKVGSQTMQHSYDSEINQGWETSYNLERYRRLVRKLNYLYVTRPHIAYLVSVTN